MKTKYIKHLAVLGMLTLGVSSCDLGVVPPDAISADSYWKTEQDAWYAMNEIYANGMPDFIDGISDEMYTDNAHSHKHGRARSRLSSRVALQQAMVQAATTIPPFALPTTILPT